jgi:hypothetical protein
MKQRSKETMNRVLVALILCILVIGCKKERAEDKALVFSASGDITAKLTEFRNLLGNLNNTTGLTSGRREVNWDGVPDSLEGKSIPGDFFNPTEPGSQVSLQRGLVYAIADNARVSKTGFSDINSNASSEFSSFSGNKTFSVVNANRWPVSFEVPGQNREASVKGFGAVFSDVDKANSTSIEFFNGQASLGQFFVPPHNNQNSFSFLAVYFPNAVITEIHISHEGKLIDGEKDITQGGSRDLIVLDDFIYSEPLAR